ncbi:MAG: hypothetical protein LBF41_07905, partial [Deltaproteobacteria bacterium]|nr:hypothetical protein [Deltaproteobacteria bacterium]
NDRRGDGRKDRNDRNDRDEDKTYLDRFGRRVDKDGRLVDQYGRYVDSRGNLVGNLFADQLYPKNWSLEKAQGRRAERRLSGPIRYVRGDGDDWRGVLDRVSLGLLADYVGWRDEYNRGKWDTRQEAMFRYVHDNVLISFRTVRNPTKSEWNAQARIVLSEYLDKNATEISLNDGNYRVMFADRSQNPGRSEWYDTSVSEIVLDSRDEVVVIKNDSEGSSSTSVRGPVSSGVTVIVRDR